MTTFVRKFGINLLVCLTLFTLHTAPTQAQFKQNVDSLQTHRIPTQFRVFGSVVVVEMDSAYCNRENAWGIWNIQRRLIRLNNSSEVAQELLEQTFWHEFTHCVLEHIEREDLSRNEKFVRLFSRALQQSFATMRFSGDSTVKK
jgi:hypothetical protein